MAKQTPQNPLVLSHQAMLALGLKKQPFTETILTADAVFSDSIFEQFVETLKHHLQFSDLLLIVEGNLGSGKTTLYRRLIQEEIANLYLLPLQAEATDTIVQLQQKISIHLKEQGNANYIDDNLKHLQVFDQKPVVIIDDAHVLSDTTLQELLRYQKQLETDKEVNIKILFFANKGMAQTLEQITDLQHNQLYVQEMPALTSKQINAFINHKLMLSGYREAGFLSDEQLKVIAGKSKGLPIDVMKLAAIEIEKWVKQQTKKQFKFKLSKPVLIALILIVVIAGTGTIFFSLQSFMNDQVTEISKPISLPVKPQTRNIPGMEPLVVGAEAQANEPETESLTTMAVGPQPESGAISDIPTTSIDSQEPELIPEADIASAPDAENVVIESQPVVTVEAAILEPAKPSIPLAAPVAENPSKPDTTPAPAQPEKPKVVAKTQIGDPVLQRLSQLGIRNSAWLKTQNPAHWTLQILGARDPQTLVNFVTQHKLNTDDTAWYVTEMKGQPWYVLLYHFYTDQNIARQSIARLPAEVQQGSPWVKSIGAVQKAIKP